MIILLSVLYLSLYIGKSVSFVYFNESFDDDTWKDRWTVSTWKTDDETGKWMQTPGDWYVNEDDKGIKTATDYRYYAISAEFTKELSNKDKDLFIHFLSKHEQGLDCGGGYIKLFGDVDPVTFGGDTNYSIMFGPDKCAMNKKTHVILNYGRPKGDTKPKNMEHLAVITSKDDTDAHLYTLCIYKNNSYDVRIDGESVSSGNLVDNWPFRPEKEINDPSKSKPKDWVDEEKIPDPTDTKPEGWDDIPAQIPDPDAKKPEDWDDEDDGEWEVPMIDNPEYKGEWKPKMIDNPDYKGPWIHPKIPNPDYFENDDFHARCKKCMRVGIDIWQVKSGTLFDDILITDNKDESDEHEKKIIEKINELKEKREEKDKEEEEKRKETEVNKDGKDSDKEAEDESDSEEEEPVKDEL